MRRLAEKNISRFLLWGLSGVLVCLFASGAFVAWKYPPSFLKIQEVVVMTPLPHLSEYDLVRLSGVQKGDNIVRLDLERVREDLLRYPWIRSVRLSKKIPARLLIWVEEHIPVALLEFNGKKGVEKFLVSREGVVFKKVEPKDSGDFPIISGLSEGTLTNLSATLALIQDFEALDSAASLGISEIQWNAKGDVSLFTREPCIRLLLGKRDWKIRLERFGDAWETLTAQGLKPKLIDLTLDKKMIVKKEEVGS